MTTPNGSLFAEADTLTATIAGDEQAALEAAELAAHLDLALARGWLDRLVDTATSKVTLFEEDPIGEHMTDDGATS